MARIVNSPGIFNISGSLDITSRPICLCEFLSSYYCVVKGSLGKDVHTIYRQCIKSEESNLPSLPSKYHLLLVKNGNPNFPAILIIHMSIHRKYFEMWCVFIALIRTCRKPFG